MNNLLTYLLELNASLIILFLAYRLFFEKDRNFTVRRIYLLGAVLLPLLLPLVPTSVRMPVGTLAPVAINLEEITIFGTVPGSAGTGSFSLVALLFWFYLATLSLGILKIFMQLTRIIYTVLRSGRFEVDGTELIASKPLHASSFFNYIFLDPDTAGDESFRHILDHETVHKRQWHSVDRILVEIFVIMNWFNPVAWMFRRSVIENLEYLADSAVLRTGTDPTNYQLSILNQYIGSASISNQFSSQIKNRINMLNKNYKLGSRWKIALLLPLTALSFLVLSCTDKETPVKDLKSAEETVAQAPDMEVFTVVEEMPAFNGGDPATEFRRYIAQNLTYPPEAAEAGAAGKVFITFIIDKEGKVVLPEKEDLAKIEGKALGEVVVVGYKGLEGAEEPEGQYIQLLKDEVIRVVTGSPDWTPGRQDGQAVNVMFTFPVNFLLQ